MEINYVGMVNVCQTVIPAMVARDEGEVILYGSTAGLMPMQRFGAYGASKAANNFYAGLLIAENRSKVRMTLVYPPAVNTPLLDQAVDGPPTPQLALWPTVPGRGTGRRGRGGGAGGAAGAQDLLPRHPAAHRAGLSQQDHRLGQPVFLNQPNGHVRCGAQGLTRKRTALIRAPRRAQPLRRRAAGSARSGEVAFPSWATRALP